MFKFPYGLISALVDAGGYGESSHYPLPITGMSLTIIPYTIHQSHTYAFPKWAGWHKIHQ